MADDVGATSTGIVRIPTEQLIEEQKQGLSAASSSRKRSGLQPGEFLSCSHRVLHIGLSNDPFCLDLIRAPF